jgi:predicted helicase
LVAKDRFTGELTAVQCKFLDPQAVIAKGQIDSFISASPTPEFTHRLLAHTARIGPTAQRTLEAQDPPVQILDPHQMDRSDIEWAEFQVAYPDRMVHKSGKKSPFPYQLEAMADVAAGFEKSDRGKLIMACGTGKTFTSLQIMQQQTPKNATVLFLVPSIALLDQTLREWKNDAAEDFHALAVCSDSKVGKNRAEEDISTTELVIPATTDASRLMDQIQLTKGFEGRTVVFSTYQSIDVIREAQQQGFAEFDLIICDEAHRTTGATFSGEEESAFTKIHNNSFIKGKKRLYMTATPRVFDDNTKKKADENSAVLASMDNVDLYGPEFHRLGFGQAVSQGLLTDYKVLVLAVDETSVNDHLQRLLTDEEGELGIDDVAKIVGCWNGLSYRGHSKDDHPQHAKAMERAVAFASNIEESKRVASMFEKITEELGATDKDSLVCRAEHVDGSMNVAERSAKLNWLEGTSRTNEARILTNARCLSEGVDVPSLDAVMFLNPRNSQVDVVQSVGRVMRRAQDKDYGYIILPVGVPVGVSPDEALKDSRKYKVIWSVLNALRSHDDRFEATVNKIDLNQDRSDKIDIIGVGVGADDDDSMVGGKQLALDMEFPGLDEWKDAIYAKIVEKVGDRKYWEDWASDIADVAKRHTQRITTLVTQNPEPYIAERFAHFVTALKHNLNQGITETDAISMLSQHLITKPVFDALFEGYDFAANNPVSVVMQEMVDILEGNNLQAETASLEGFYNSVAERAAGIDNPEGKQQIITELYENFFKQAFPAQANALGVVYTPVEIVDFIIRAVNDLSLEHFGSGLTEEGVHVLDPFTGTGTFIVRLLQSGVITPHDLARKYATELHANEIMLLAYYIAAINIEATYHGLLTEQAEIQSMHSSDQVPYVPFEGIVLGDTFQMTEEDNTFDIEFFTSNNERAKRQLDTDIRIIIGNPPWRSGQKSANEDNQNTSYPTLDSRIRKSYLSRTTSTLRRKAYDSYIRAIRWGTDRLGNKGILAFVTNGGYIDNNFADGIRKALVEDFDQIYIYNLRGGDPRSGDKSEGGNVFDVMVTVAIIIGVKDPSHVGSCEVFYRDIGDYLSKEEKLRVIRESDISSVDWEVIRPNAKGEWINQSSDIFDELLPLGIKKPEPGVSTVFSQQSLGVSTNRDPWVYQFSEGALLKNVARLSGQFNQDVEAIPEEGPRLSNAEAKNYATYDDATIKWSRGLLQRLAKAEPLPQPSSEQIRISMYRPFCKQRLFYDSPLIEMPSRTRDLFPTEKHKNIGIYWVGMSSAVPLSAIAMDVIPNLHVTGAGSGGQFFPRYSWKKLGKTESSAFNLNTGTNDVVIDGYQRIDNITDATLLHYQRAFGSKVTKDAIFEHVYALLHSEQYRSTFAAELRRQLPRVPLPSSSEDFWALSRAGRELLDLHLNYESVEPYPLHEESTINELDDPKFYEVKKMKWGNKERSRLVYNTNLALSGIPDEAHEYQIGSRSALEWLIDRYQIRTDKSSGIVNDPNEWVSEVDQPRYIVDLIKRITAVSVRTVQITRTLPELQLD